MSDPDTLYDTDFFAWTKDQAEALRDAVGAMSVPRANRAIDWENVAEEIDGLGKSLRGAMASQIRRILHHLLKLEFSRSDRPHHGWRRSVREARIAIEDILDESPSLRSEVAPVVAKQMRHAVQLAAADLRDYGEADAEARLRTTDRTYDPDGEVLADWWPSGPSV